MKYHNKTVALALAMMISMAGTAFAQTVFEQDVARAVAQAQQKQQQKNAVVNVSVYWSKADNNAAQAQYTQKQCKGILTQDSQVLFPAVCLKNSSRVQLKEVGFSFSNGKIQPVAMDEITMNADMAVVAAKPQAVEGLQGLPVEALNEGKAMRPFFKQFLLDRGVLPMHYHGGSNHEPSGMYAYREASIKVGDPVMYQGKVIALVKEVPAVVSAKAENCFAWLH